MLRPLLLCALVLLFLSSEWRMVESFTPSSGRRISFTTNGRSSGRKCRSVVMTRLAAESDDEEFDVDAMLDSAEMLTLVMEEHKPLGCTVEESLAYPEAKIIFVSKVKKGSFAEAAGMMVGDVISGVSGVFGEMKDTVGMGVEPVKGLVASRPREDPLQVRVVRGTTILSDHETALVDLCAGPDLDDKELNKCIDIIMSEDFSILGESGDFVEEELEEGQVLDTEAEELLDSVESLWKDEIPAPPNRNKRKVEEKVTLEEKPKPWNRRSSPSGTYVRDPKTGIMRNIDAY